jgi:uncharacterized Zn-finger protein
MVKTYTKEFLKKAHEHSRRNFTELKNSKICICFYCKKTFKAKEITDWVEESDNNKTARCPYCRIDSVIGDKSGIDITDIELIDLMYELWFSY